MENIQNLIRCFLEVPQDAGIEKTLAGQLKCIMDWMPGGFFLYKAEGDEALLYANEAVLRIFLCDTMEELRRLTGNSFRGIVHPDDLERVEESIKVQIANSQFDLDYVEYRIIRKDGSIRWVDDYGHFIHCEDGDIFCVFIGDNTEKKMLHLQQEQNLQNRVEAYHQELEGISEEYLRRLEVIEGLSADYESIFYVDLDSDTIQTYQLNDRLENLFDQKCRTRPFSSFITNYINQWVYPEDRERIQAFLSPEGLRKNLGEHRTCDMDYRIADGSDVIYFQLYAANAGSHKQVGQVILGVRSVDSFIRNTIQQREVLEGALHQANLAAIAKTSFLANMSHDMRTPMNAILGFTALAKRYVHDSDRTSGYLDMIEVAGNQLLQLVNEVLEIARMESGKLQQEETECDLLQILHQVMAGQAMQARIKKITLLLETDHVKQSLIYCDGGKLQKFLGILLDNAVKYTPPGGRVELSAEELESSSPGYGTYRLTVKDNGIGISKEFQERMFLPFERQKNTTSSRVPGTGLGLTIAKSILDIMDGKLTMESELGQGTSFTTTFTFREKKQKPRPVRAEQKAADMKKGKILLAEDNELNIEIEKELLEGEGYTVDVAENGRIAVEMVRQSRPGEYAIIFMDIQMPVMDGYQATREIRALEDAALAQIPIIAVSANAFDEDKRKSSACGMNDHIPKPVDIAELLTAIQYFTRIG